MSQPGLVLASDGTVIDDGLAQTLAYNAAGQLTTITVTKNGKNYVQTLTYNAAGQLTNVSQWMKQ